MNKKHLFAFLEDQDSPTLLRFLGAAYEAMNTDQRHAVFGRTLKKTKPPPVHGQSLLKEVKQFQRDSLAGKYYAPFDINSKNYTHIPEETNAWFERMGDLLAGSVRLSQQGDHVHAVACFRILYELVEAMESGQEIVFADECGDWMIPGEPKPTIAAYLTSLAASATPEEYAAAAIPFIREDSLRSSSHKTYDTAIRTANKTQKAHLKSEVQRLKIPTKPRSRT